MKVALLQEYKILHSSILSNGCFCFVLNYNELEESVFGTKYKILDFPTRAETLTVESMFFLTSTVILISAFSSIAGPSSLAV